MHANMKACFCVFFFKKKMRNIFLILFLSVCCCCCCCVLWNFLFGISHIAPKRKSRSSDLCGQNMLLNYCRNVLFFVPKFNCCGTHILYHSLTPSRSPILPLYFSLLLTSTDIRNECAPSSAFSAL